MSTVVIVNNANAGFQQNQGVSTPPIENVHTKKDSKSKRIDFGILGSVAIAGGIYGQIKSWKADDRFMSQGKSGEILDKEGFFSFKSWGHAIKANPRGFLASMAIDAVSTVALFAGAVWLQRAFTGHKAEKKKDKS